MLARLLRLGIYPLAVLLAAQTGMAKGKTSMATFHKETEFSVAAPEPDVVAAAWSPDGRALAVLASLVRQVTVLTVPDGKAAYQIKKLAGAARGVGFTAQGQVVVPAQGDVDAVTIWDPQRNVVRGVRGPDAASGTPVTNLLFDFAIDRARTRLAGLHYVKQGAGNALRVAVYDMTTWQLLADLPMNVSKVALSPDGRMLAAIEGNHVVIVDSGSGAVLSRFQANLNNVQLLAWSADGRRIATGTLGQGFGVDPRTGRRGRLIDADVLQLWDAATGNRIAAVRQPVGGGVESLEFSDDGSALVTTTADGACRLWDPESLELQQTVAENLHPGTVLARFSPGAQRLAVIRTGPAQAILFRR